MPRPANKHLEEFVKENLSSAVRHAREKREMTGRELASRVAVSPQTMSKIERGVTLPSLMTLLRLQDELGVDLFGWVEYRYAEEKA